MVTRRSFVRALGAGVLTAPFACLAQNQPKVWQIGFLAADSASTKFYDNFRQAMRDLGYAEGKTCVILPRFADGKYERLPNLAQELVRSNPDVIVAGTTLSVQAAKKATTRIPIVMVAIADPVGEGF